MKQPRFSVAPRFARTRLIASVCYAILLLAARAEAQECPAGFDVPCAGDSCCPSDAPICVGEFSCCYEEYPRLCEGTDFCVQVLSQCKCLEDGGAACGQGCMPELGSCCDDVAGTFCGEVDECCGRGCMPLGAECCDANTYCPEGFTCTPDGCTGTAIVSRDSSCPGSFPVQCGESDCCPSGSECTSTTSCAFPALDVRSTAPAEVADDQPSQDTCTCSSSSKTVPVQFFALVFVLVAFNCRRRTTA